MFCLPNSNSPFYVSQNKHDLTQERLSFQKSKKALKRRVQLIGVDYSTNCLKIYFIHTKKFAKLKIAGLRAELNNDS